MPSTTEGVRDPEAVLRSLRAERGDHRRTKAALNAAEQRATSAGLKLQREKRTSEDAAAEAAELRDRLADAELRLAQLEASIDAGLPREAAPRLRGSTPEELAADAADLAALRASAAR